MPLEPTSTPPLRASPALWPNQNEPVPHEDRSPPPPRPDAGCGYPPAPWPRTRARTAPAPDSRSPLARRSSGPPDAAPYAECDLLCRPPPTHPAPCPAVLTPTSHDGTGADGLPHRMCIDYRCFLRRRTRGYYCRTRCCRDTPVRRRSLSADAARPPAPTHSAGRYRSPATGESRGRAGWHVEMRRTGSWQRRHRPWTSAKQVTGKTDCAYGFLHYGVRLARHNAESYRQ